MKPLILISLLLLSGCSTITTNTFSIGLKEQYVVKNAEASTTEFDVYDVKEAPVKGDVYMLLRDTNPSKQTTVARYKWGSTYGSITEMDIDPPSKVRSIIPMSELNCPPCIKPKRYRKPAGYLAFPLLAVAVPLDLAATPVAAAVAVPFLIAKLSIVAISGSPNKSFKAGAAPPAQRSTASGARP